MISCRNDNRLVFQTFDKAIAANPGARPLFTATEDSSIQAGYFKGNWKEQKMEQSMSRVGHCIDNGPTEGFWGILKAEMYQMYEITDEASLRFAIEDYIRFYSKERPQERYQCKSPQEVRIEALTTNKPPEYPIAKEQAN